ncbi:MAG: hypothetical protein IKN13_02985, partial [Bacteroidales bacterium]|nr:hypothetical protein [Bacteroidales bacterium]
NNDFKKASINSFGSVSDGKFVDEEMACKSGFALKFYLCRIPRRHSFRIREILLQREGPE